MRLLLFTGKGGVGKTTLAAATAATLAEQGKRTLVVSTDPAHSLADSFGVPVGSDPVAVRDRLRAVQVDPRALADSVWHELRGQLRTALTGVGIEALDAEELTVLPGVDELLALGEVRRHAVSGYWHAVVVDCGPTAETLRLLALPEAIAEYLRRLYGWRKGQRGRGGAAATARGLADHLESLRALLTDTDTTAVRLVLTPERMVVAETRRTLTALALRGIRVDGLVANRLMPAPGFWRGGAASWLRQRRAEQEEVLAELREVGLPPVRIVEHSATEPVGLDALAEISRQLYDGGDPLAGDAPGQGTLLQVRPGPDGGYRLRVALPLAGNSAVELARVDDDLAITLDGHRRLVALPELLRAYEVTGAEYDEDGLVVSMGPPACPGGPAGGEVSAGSVER
ncbi:ArsA family ATPase [Haloechinothrix sp. LS1_15]|uniref:ArsA family ATPase n=1 Tax=Haloechinothrix sp. LS1_15 TaxID=2652248 RepID=UPI002945F44F|nr:ArsA family ATPase [Haloechinothrix sp. LS1_15]MDV6013450.1 ArsA family ATPase [Haloechinothrix sp. LS1_15]